MKRSLRHLVTAAALTLVTPAMAEQPWERVNLSLATEHIAPRYAQLADSSSELQQRLHSLCEHRDATRLNAARESFHTTMSAWQGIQHIRFGPVELFLRHHRMQHWPDKHGTGPKQLRRMLLTRNREELKPDNFRHLSVAVQGLNTLERLLFEPDTEITAFRTGDQASYHCRLAAAIGQNIALMGKGLSEAWHGDYLQTVKTAATGNDYFSNAKELSGKLLNNLYTELQAVVDQKLLRPMGESAQQARPRRAESWRSRRSLQNIEANLTAAEEMYRIGFAPLLADNSELAGRIDSTFARAVALCRKNEESLYDSAADPELRPALQRLLSAVSELKRLIGGELPSAIDLPLGFNALDGD